MDLQETILDNILKRFPKKSAAVKELADLLDTGQNAVYRRIRGESILTPREIALLARHYNISLDAIVQEQSENVLFVYPAIVDSIQDFEKYLNSILDDLKELQHLPNISIKYAASECPIFYYCFFPELISFKLYTWGKTALGFNYLADIPFRFNLISPDVHAATRDLLQQYMELPSTELWNLNILDNTLNQIEYYYESGSIDRLEDALVLCDRMNDLVDHLKQMAAKGKKFPVGAKQLEGRKDWQLFHNEMVDTNNTIIVSSDKGKAIYNTYGNPHFLKVMDQRVAEYIDQWFNRILAKSQLINTYEKARNQYFKKLLQKVERTKKRLEMTKE